jgi:hypothetical protein
MFNVAGARRFNSPSRIGSLHARATSIPLSLDALRPKGPKIVWPVVLLLLHMDCNDPTCSPD